MVAAHAQPPLRVYYGQRRMRPNYGLRKRNRRTGQYECESNIVTRGKEKFLANSAVLCDPDFYPQTLPKRDLVSLVLVTPEGAKIIETIESAAQRLRRPNWWSGQWFVLMPPDDIRAEYNEFLSVHRQFFPALEPGELFDEIAQAAMGPYAPKTALVSRPVIRKT